MNSEQFRKKVGGDISIFLLSCIFLAYPAVMIPAFLYSLWCRQWRDAVVSLCISILGVGLARGIFLLSHWWFKLTDKWIDKLRAKIEK